MSTCAICGKVDKASFVCKHCGKYFCADHRIQEMHNCRDVPSGPRDSYPGVKLFTNPVGVLFDIQRYDCCPKCHSYLIVLTSFDEEIYHWTCKMCRNIWTKPR